MTKQSLTTDQKIWNLYVELAGEKLEKVTVTTEELVAAGKRRNRAMADSLEKHKCLKNPKAEELQ